MKVQSVNNVSFGARIKIGKELKGCMAEFSQRPELSTGSSVLGGIGSLFAGASSTQTVATASDVAASAFLSKGIGVNSSGIAPSVMAKLSPIMTPASVASANENPSIIGSIASSIGAFMHRLGGEIRINSTQKKIPS